jgi:hypothetical protein
MTESRCPDVFDKAEVIFLPSDVSAEAGNSRRSRDIVPEIMIGSLRFQGTLKLGLNLKFRVSTRATLLGEYYLERSEPRCAGTKSTLGYLLCQAKVQARPKPELGIEAELHCRAASAS